MFAGAFNSGGMSTMFKESVVWSISDTAIAGLARKSGSKNVNVDVRGRRPGLVTVTATSQGISRSDTVRVIPTLRGLHIVPGAFTVAVGDTFRVNGVAQDLEGREVPGLHFVWEPENPSVATMGGNGGLVLGRTPGTARIRARIAGVSAYATATVIQR